MNNEKLPPHDLDAEEAIIGSLLIDGTAIYKIATVLNRGDFHHERNQWLYEACLTLYERNEAINQITMAQELARRDKLEAVGGAAFLSHLISVCPTPLDIEHYAQIVYRLSIMDMASVTSFISARFWTNILRRPHHLKKKAALPSRCPTCFPTSSAWTNSWAAFSALTWLSLPAAPAWENQVWASALPGTWP